MCSSIIIFQASESSETCPRQHMFFFERRIICHSPCASVAPHPHIAIVKAPILVHIKSCDGTHHIVRDAFVIVCRHHSRCDAPTTRAARINMWSLWVCGFSLCQDGREWTCKRITQHRCSCSCFCDWGLMCSLTIGRVN